MHRARNQAGLTFIGIIFLLIPIILVAYVVVRAVPAYIEAYSVGDVINSLKKEVDLKDKPKEEIYKMIQKRLEINNIQSVTQDNIKIQKTPTEVAVSVDYESRIPLFGNAALALAFHKSAVLR